MIYQQTDSQIRLNLPKVFGKGGESMIQLRKGLRLMLRDCELQQSVRFVKVIWLNGAAPGQLFTVIGSISVQL